MADLETLQARAGYHFRDGELLRLALTHPSVSVGGAVVGQTNQRLEFLGDAVLQLALSRELYLAFPGFEEGALTKARAALVNRRSLAEQSRRLGLGAHLIVSRGEEDQGGRHRTSALADTFEAVLGAVFLDGGFEAARDFVARQFLSDMSDLALRPASENPKGELQERLQAVSACTPRYRLVSVSGLDHDKCFECAVDHDGVELGRGSGKSKKAAESEAARSALRSLRERDAKLVSPPVPPTGGPE